jgi:DNA invertase Pin-like site-specific DNA recombinase
MKRVAIYLRVSTDKQTTNNQRRELEAVAERSGWGSSRSTISGAKGRDQRPGLDAMMKAVNAKEFDMVATWSVERLGRSLTDLLSILQAHTDLKKGARIVALARSLYSGHSLSDHPLVEVRCWPFIHCWREASA